MEHIRKKYNVPAKIGGRVEGSDHRADDKSNGLPLGNRESMTKQMHEK